MKAELQEVLNRLRKLQGAIDFGNAPMLDGEELAGDVTDTMDAVIEVMKTLPGGPPRRYSHHRRARFYPESIPL